MLEIPRPMPNRIPMRLSIAALLLWTSAAAFAAPADDTWMSVMLDGRKIGHMHTTRTVKGDRVTTTQALSVELDRAGVKVSLTTSEIDTETRDGKPLAFATTTGISGTASIVRGEVRPDGTCEVTTEVGGNRQVRTIVWPRGALLAEGLRLAEEKSGLAPGTHIRETAFQAESLDAVDVESTVGAREIVDLPDGRMNLIKVEQLIHLSDAPTKSVSWIDDDENVRKLTMPLMGFELTMQACSQACAKAPNQGTDILTHAMAKAPAAITTDELRHGVVLKLSAKDGGDPLRFASTDEQRVTTTADGVELHIAPLGSNPGASREEAPTPADTAPNDWLQSDAPEIRRLAAQGAGDAKTAHDRMQRLEGFVRSYIVTKDLSVGYASALEVAKKPEGDCTEHAVLLAALGRALGIPTRVVDGLVYADHYAGADHVFVPHAWAQAYVDGHWQSFDAALFGFDAGHLALSVGDGDPWRFYSGLDTLGRMKVEAVAAAQ